MIFSPDMEQAVRFGRKTMTRRAVCGHLRCPQCRRTEGLGALCMDCAVRTVPVEAPRYRVGKTYAVQPGRGMTATCRILVTSVHAEPVGYIDHDDAKAEGFPTGVQGFAAKWLELHDKKWFEAKPPVEWHPDTLLERFETKHARTMVWVIAFQVAIPDTPRLLAVGSGGLDPAKARKDQEMRERGLEIVTTDQDRGYTSTPARAIPHEPEAVDEETQAWISETAGLEHGQWQARERALRDREREQLSLGTRLDQAIVDARLEGRATSRELRVIEKRIAELEKAGRAIRLRAA